MSSCYPYIVNDTARRTARHRKPGGFTMKSNIALHYTKHRGKLSGLYSLSTSPLTNEFCKAAKAEICKKCYASRLASFRSNVESRLLDNSAKLAGTLPSEALIIPEHIRKIGYLRINSFGELINKHHARNIVRMAMLNPSVQITIWTKRPQLFREFAFIPENLHIIFSEATLNVSADTAQAHLNVVKAYVPAVKAIYYVGEKSHGFAPCGDKCSECRRCYPCTDGDLIAQRLH